MDDPEYANSILALKQAGIERMRLRQQRVHERMAAYVASDPQALLLGKEQLARLLERPQCASRELYLEWQMILDSCSRSQIVALLRDQSAETEQLRACAPFVVKRAVRH